MKVDTTDEARAAAVAVDRLGELLDWQKLKLTSWKGKTKELSLSERLEQLSNSPDLTKEERVFVLGYTEARTEARVR